MTMKYLLRQLIKEVITSSNSDNFEKIKKTTGGVMLQRVGGLSPVRQRNNNFAPADKGIWAFVYPYFDDFFLSATNDRGLAEPSDESGAPRGGSRLMQREIEGTRKFVHAGPLYTRINVPGSILIDGWYYTTGAELKKYLPKFHAKLTGEMQRLSMRDSKGNPLKNPTTYPTRSKPEKYFSVDHFEVFVPHPFEG